MSETMMEFNRVYLLDQIRENGSVKIYKKTFDNDPYDILEVSHVAKERAIAVDKDGDEDSFLVSDLIKDFQPTDPRPEEKQLKEVDLEDDCSFYLSKKGEIAIVLNNSEADDILLEDENYERIKVG